MIKLKNTNLAILVGKPKFDLLLAQFFKKIGIKNIFLLTANPLDYLRLKINTPPDIFLISLYDLPPTTPQLEDKNLASNSIFYPNWLKRIQDRVEKRVASLRIFFEKFFREKNISALILSDKEDLPFLVAGNICRNFRIPTLYLGTGIFRGKSFTASPFPLRPFKPEIWEKRLSAYNSVTPPKIYSLPKFEFSYQTSYKKPSFLSTWQYKLRYFKNPYFLQKHPELYQKNFLYSRFWHHCKKRYYQWISRKTSEPNPPTFPFILLPLQGNEICQEVPSPLGIENMHNLLEKIVDIFKKTHLYKRFYLVVKEHPNRPGVIPYSFKKDLPPWVIFYRQYPLSQLFENAALIVTYNSLAGFEALLKRRRVLCLAPIFYNLKNLVLYPKNENDLLYYLTRFEDFAPDWQKLEQLCSFIWNFTQLKIQNFSRRKPSLEGLKLIAGRLLYLIQENYLPPKEWI